MRRSAPSRSLKLKPVALSLAAVLAGLLGTPVVADAALQTIPGNPLLVHLDDRGQIQSRFVTVAAANYYPPDSLLGNAGFFLAFPAGAPAQVAGDVYGFSGAPAGPNTINYTAVSNGPPTGAGTPASPYQNVTVYRVPVGGSNVEITQTVSYVDGSGTFTAQFDVRNNTAAAIPFRALFAADLFNAGDDRGTGVFLPGPPRFIGGANPSTGVVGGFTEVGAPSPPWTRYEEANYDTIWTKVENSATNTAFVDTIDASFIDNGAGVQWDTRCPACVGGGGGTSLPAGATQTFQINTLNQQPGTFTLVPATQTAVQGRPYAVVATLNQASGEPYAGQRVRFVVAGANAQVADVDANAAGQAGLGVTPANAGADSIVAFADFNRDGVRQPNTEPQAAATVTVQAPPPPNPAFVGGVGMSPRAFSAAPSGPTAQAAQRRRTFGSIVTFRLNRPAMVRFVVQRRTSGRRVGGRCVRSTGRNRRARRCVRHVGRGSFSRAGAVGANRFRFRGRVSGRTLRDGRYRLRATPAVGSVRGRTVNTAFRIRRR